MSAEHNDFVALGGSGDFGDDIAGDGVVFVEGGLDIDAYLDVFLFFNESHEAVVVFGDHGELQGSGIFAGVVGAVTGYANDTGVAGAEFDEGEHFFIDPELAELLLEGQAFLVAGSPVCITIPGNGEFFDVAEVFEVVAIDDGVSVIHTGYTGIFDEENFSFERTFILLEVFFFFNFDALDFSGDGTVGAGGPGFGKRKERNLDGGDEVDIRAGEGPSAAECPPLFELSIFESVPFERGAGPFGGFTLLGGVRDAGSDFIGEMADGVHDLGAVEAFASNLGDHVPVDRFLCRDTGQDERGDEE